MSLRFLADADLNQKIISAIARLEPAIENRCVVLDSDAHGIAAVIERGGGLVLTSDPEDLEHLATSYRNVMAIPLT